jgi:hypothetical protein
MRKYTFRSGIRYPRMKGISAASPSRLSEAWRSLEEIGFLWGLGAGVLIGGLAGSIALYHEPRTLSLALGLAALAAAALLTFLGRPVVAPLPAMELVPAMAPAPFSRVEDIPGLVSMVVLPAGEFRMGSADDDDSAYDHE